MPTSSRPSPVIPDHEVLRKIGGGAYGEVWLARGVTGAMRAVKVVWREDFEDERGFEREFEGILKFEPISRDHPALVNILHVGRSPDGVSFYYYVMELGDDVRDGQDINPIEYEPRTLRADTRQADRTRLEPALCIDVGLRLSEALHHLHERGLAHRDVKPSNVIFVHGRAKLADIGLVAARGQRTFVGTEGFVPPEGPGSAQADVYSLGKVLYEIATGKDRLDFPELPEGLPEGREGRRWQELNRIICDICEPRISKRRITTAGALADALRRLQRGKRRRRGTGRAAWVTALVLAGFSGWAAWEMGGAQRWWRELPVVGKETPPAPVEPPMGMVRISSTQEGAEVLAEDGRRIGFTPTETFQVPVGERVSYTIRMPGYRPLQVAGLVPPAAVNEALVLFGELENFSPPVPGEPWDDHLGSGYVPDGEVHISTGFVTRDHWLRFLDVSKRSPDAVEFLSYSQDGEPVEIALVSREEAIAYCDWLRVGGLQGGYLTEDHEVVPQPTAGFEHPDLGERARREGLLPLRLVVRPIAFATIELTSRPSGADVYLNGQAVGSTIGPLAIPRVKPGPVELLLVLEGYKPLTETFSIGPNETRVLSLEMEENQGVVFGRPWENGIGMRFAPLGNDLMVSIWETRVADYRAFVEESGYPEPPPTEFEQGPDHPVVNVSREDAIAFCDWLTRRERAAERIAVSHVYRLPTDMEWSWMVGLEEEPGLGPGWRDTRKERVFPWGRTWPARGEAVGNFADLVAAMEPGIRSDRTIPNYDDGFAHTAPVGSFLPNHLGLYDLSGNVHEWVEDAYSSLGDRRLGVVRGGGWNTFQREQLYSGSRNPLLPGSREPFYGFRVVLAKVPPKVEPPRGPREAADPRDEGSRFPSDFREVFERGFSSPVPAPLTPLPEPE